MANPKEMNEELERLLRVHFENLSNFIKKHLPENNDPNSPTFKVKRNIIATALNEARDTKGRLCDVCYDPLLYVASDKDKAA